MEAKVRVSAVSYLNSIPFIYGLEQSDLLDQIDLSLDIPSSCAEKLLADEVDLGLVPVAIIPQLKNYHIISPYCIGADGAVETVCLFSDVPWEEVETVLLDFHSRTSVQLVQLLAKHHWKVDWQFVNTEEDFEHLIGGTTAAVVIGDRAYQYREKHTYVYDLPEVWKEYSGLPFVFACWVSNKELPLSFVKEFSAALSLGMQQKEKALQLKGEAYESAIDKYRYLDEVIKYDLDTRKRQGLDLFLKLLKA
jgi:chorismate dehydratase